MNTLITVILLLGLAALIFGSSAVNSESNVMYMTESDYIKMQKEIIKVYKTDYPTAWLPLKSDLPLDARKFRMPYGVEGEVSYPVPDWSENLKRAEAQVNYNDYELFPRQMTMYFNSKEQRTSPEIVVHKKKIIYSKFLDDIDNDILYGQAKATVKTSTGFLGNCAKIENLDGTDSALVGAAGLYAGMKKMLKSVAAIYRANAPVVLWCDLDFYDLLTDKQFDGGKTVWDKIKSSYMSPESPVPLAIAKLVATDKVLNIDQRISTSLSADTEGTHHRIVAYPWDNNLCGKLFSRIVSRVGEGKDRFGNLIQDWGSVHVDFKQFASTTGISEQITYSDT